MTKPVQLQSAILLAGLLVLPATAEVYQWRDADGKVHFSDKKPQTRPAQVISASLQPLNLDESSTERQKLERLFKPETAAEKALREREAGEQAQRTRLRDERCTEARNYLQALQGPVFFVADDGSSYTISEAERQQQAAELAAQMREHCP